MPPSNSSGCSIALCAVLAFLLSPTCGASFQQTPKPAVVPQLGHSNGIESVAFSPDGNFVLSGSHDGTVKLWETASGRFVRTFEGHQDEVYSVAFSPDGRFVLSGGSTLELFETATGRLVRSFEGHRQQVRSVAFSPGGRFLVSGSWDGSVKLWETESGKFLRNFEEHGKGANSVAFSPDGRFVLSGGLDNILKLWETVNGRFVRKFEGHQDSINSVAFSPDGRFALSASSDKTSKLWETATGRLVRNFEGHQDWVKSVAFSPDGRLLLSGSFDKTVKVWNSDSGRLVRDFEVQEKDAVSSVAFSPDGRFVLSATISEASFTLRETVSGGVIRTFEGPGRWISSIAFSPNGQFILSGGWDGKLRLWEAESGRLMRSFAGHQGPVHSAAFSSDGHFMLSGTWNGVLQLWDIKSSQLARSFTGAQAPISSIAFSPDGRFVLSGNWNGIVSLWETETGQLVRTFPGHVYVAFSPDGRLLLLGRSTLELFETSSGRLVRSFEGQNYIHSVAFSPDGGLVLSGDEYGNLKLWETVSGREVHSINAHRDRISSVVFSPDGRFALSGSWDKTAKLWETASGRLIRTFEGHQDRVTAVAFSPDGRRTTSVSNDGTVKIWSATDGELQATLIPDAKEWIAITPIGFFALSSPTATKSLSIVRGLEVYDVNQMYQSLYDPDLVREKLSGDPDGEFAKAASVLDLGKVLDSGRPPLVELLTPTPNGASNDEFLTLKVKVAGQSGGIGRIEWRINGVTTRVTNDASSAKERLITQALALEPGENTIEVVAYNSRNLLASVPVSTTVTWSPPTTQPKPKLFVIAVGINDYNDVAFPRLRYAVNDAEALGAAIKEAGEGLYSSVEVTYVLDKDATVERLERLMTDVAARMQARDAFIFFAAAHGKSENGRFHLIPQDYRSKNGKPEMIGTISQGRLQDWFANRFKARRGLILLDTCESGALVAARASGIDLGSSQAAIGRLNEATGRPVPTAAAAKQAALEGYRGHGVFTYALLDALVHGDANNNGLIELSELASHIQSLASTYSRQLAGRGAALSDPALSAEGLENSPIVVRVAGRGLSLFESDAAAASEERRAGVRQTPRLGSRGEDFPLVRRLEALPDLQ